MAYLQAAMNGSWVEESYQRMLQELLEKSARVQELKVLKMPETLTHEICVFVWLTNGATGAINSMRFSLPYKPDGTAPILELAAMINLVAP